MTDIKVGIVGLGRLGKIHALNLSKQLPGCTLVRSEEHTSELQSQP